MRAMSSYTEVDVDKVSLVMPLKGRYVMAKKSVKKTQILAWN